jgi:hypothetical protein
VSAQSQQPAPQSVPARPATIGWPQAGGILFVALVAVLAIGAARWSDPHWTLDRGAMAASQAARFPSAGDRAIVVASFADAVAARDAFVAAEADRPPGAALALFGQSVLLAVQERNGVAAGWADRSTGQADETLAGHEAVFSVGCTAGDRAAAAALAATLGDFFTLPAALRLIPPWASPDRRAEGDRARHHSIRRTYAASGKRPAELLPALGVLPPGVADSPPDPRLQFASAGRVWADGRQLQVESVAFEDLFRGPAALVAWLRANGCAEPHYRFAAAAAVAAR